MKYVETADDVSKDHRVRLGHENVRAALVPIAGAIYFADTNSIMKGIVGNSCMAVASIHGQVFDQSPGQNKKIFCMWRSRALIILF